MLENRTRKQDVLEYKNQTVVKIVKIRTIFATLMLFHNHDKKAGHFNVLETFQNIVFV